MVGLGQQFVIAAATQPRPTRHCTKLGNIYCHHFMSSEMALVATSYFALHCYCSLLLSQWVKRMTSLVPDN